MLATYAVTAVVVGVVLAICMRSDVLMQFGGGVTDMRGSLAGQTFARCAGGNYARGRTKPVNPRSPLQNARRADVAYITKYWSNDLTEQERVDWRAYAAATNWTNKLGQSIQISGLAAFLRLNVLQRMIPSTLITAAPTAVGHAGGTALTFTAEHDTGKLQIAEPTGSFDKDIDIHTLWLSMGIPAQPGRIGIPKGFKYLERVWGSSGAPLGFPYEIDAVYTMALGQHITVRSMFQDEHYRVSGPFFADTLAVSS